MSDDYLTAMVVHAVERSAFSSDDGPLEMVTAEAAVQPHRDERTGVATADSPCRIMQTSFLAPAGTWRVGQRLYATADGRRWVGSEAEPRVG